MNPGQRTVIVLDDDESLLSTLARVLEEEGYLVRAYIDPEGLYSDGVPDSPACLILDSQLRDGMTGMNVHEEILSRGWWLPTVFLTAFWDPQSIVGAMRAGAHGFLTKPVGHSELLEAVEDALREAEQQMREKRLALDARVKVNSLTKRETDVVRLVVAGKLNKEIADILGLAVVTVKVHRGRAMQKLGAGNPAELARITGLARMFD